tara:strand:+ start:141 stop:1172 length:1032 start_codon:yes stop_codon:yes gene_type:complete
MSGIFDLHAVLALQNGWEYYRTNQNVFSSLFPGIRPVVTNGWHSELVANAPTVRTHAAAGTGDLPAIVVQLVSETRREEALGGFSRSDRGVPVYTSVIEQKIKISVLSHNAELTRALHVLVRAIMFGSLSRFLEQSYLDVTYLEGEELAPAEELAAEELGIFMRRMVWVSTTIVESPSFTDIPNQKTWFVQSEDIETQTTPGSAHQSGEAVFSEGQTTYTVPVSPNALNTSYTVTVALNTPTNGAANPTVSSKAVDGFVITLGTPSSGGLASVKWSKTGDWQPAPINQSLINPATNEPYAAQRTVADEMEIIPGQSTYGEPPFDSTTGKSGGVKPIVPEKSGG